MRVVVTGGTGFIGKALVQSLAARGDDVTILSRGDGGAPGGSVVTKRWSPEEPGDWMSVVDGADAVVHLAGAGVMDERWSDERKKVLRASRIRSTELVVDAIRRAKTRPRVLVSGSAVGYYGDGRDQTLTEDAAPGDDFLAKLTVDWEAAASAASSLGARVCLPRTGIVLGRGGGALAKMLPPFRAFVGGPVGSGKQYFPWIHLTDAARAIEHALGHAGISGPFNVTAPEPVTMDAFARALGCALGRPAVFRVPAFAAKLALGEAAHAVLTGQRAVPSKLIASGFAFLYPELDSALADIVGR